MPRLREIVLFVPPICEPSVPETESVEPTASDEVATVCNAPVPEPYTREPLVNDVAPVPPFAMGRTPLNAVAVTLPPEIVAPVIVPPVIAMFERSTLDPLERERLTNAVEFAFSIVVMRPIKSAFITARRCSR